MRDPAQHGGSGRASATIAPMAPARTAKNPLGLGRPTVGAEVATKNVTFRLMPSKHAEYVKASEAAGVSLGDWIRAACEARLPRRRGKQ